MTVCMLSISDQEAVEQEIERLTYEVGQKASQRLDNPAAHLKYEQWLGSTLGEIRRLQHILASEGRGQGSGC